MFVVGNWYAIAIRDPIEIFQIVQRIILGGKGRKVSSKLSRDTITISFLYIKKILRLTVEQMLE